MRTLQLLCLYLTGVASVVVGGHLFLVVSDPRAVGGLYLFPFMIIAPAELLGLVPAGIGARSGRRRPQTGWWLVVAASAYLVALILVTLEVERRALDAPMLPFLMSLLVQPSFVLGAWLLFTADGGVHIFPGLTVAIGAILPLLLVLLLVYRWAARPAQESAPS